MQSVKNAFVTNEYLFSHACVLNDCSLMLSFFFLQAVTLHTDLGEIKIELFCERSPKSCEVSTYRKYITSFISSL